MKRKKKSFDYKILPDGKKALNTEVINYDFLGQKTSVGTYVGYAFWIIVIILFSTYFNPACYLCLIGYPFIIYKEIKKDIKRRNFQYFVIERPCLEKEYVEPDEDPNYWQLLFKNREGDYHVSIKVSEELYNITEIGEDFYLVFAKKERTPCLCYRENDWQLVPDM